MNKLLALGTAMAVFSYNNAAAEQYVIKSVFAHIQPAQFRVILNGQVIALHRDHDGVADITRYVKPGKNSLTLDVAPGTNTAEFDSSKSTLTLGAGTGSKWRTLFKYEVGRDTRAGRVNFAFIGRPSQAAKAGKISLSTNIMAAQPVQFEIALNGETISTMNSDGNMDLTPFLKKGKNVLSVKYIPGKNTNGSTRSTLTIGERKVTGWSSLFKFAVGERDKKSGTVTFPIYR